MDDRRPSKLYSVAKGLVGVPAPSTGGVGELEVWAQQPPSAEVHPDGFSQYPGALAER